MFRTICVIDQIFSRHNQISDLHKQNLAEHHRKMGGALAGFEDDGGPSGMQLQYRDRAKERRQKYGADDAPKPNRLKEKYLRAVEHMETSAAAVGGADGKKKIGSDNKGNKMLQKMGWKDGQGLGKKNQGRTEIVEVTIILWPYYFYFQAVF